jgi:hypothetical protein
MNAPDMATSFAVKLAAIGLGSLATGAGMITAQMDEVLQGDSGGAAVVVSGGAVLAAALALLVRLTRMWMKGEIVSRVTNGNEERLVEALEAVTEALKDATESSAQISKDSNRREEIMEGIIAAYLPDKKC